MVSDGLTPRFEGTVDPSTTWMPGWPWRRWYGSTTPSSGVVPSTAPPRKWPVTGMFGEARRRADRHAADPAGDPARDLVPGGDPGRVALAVGGRAGQPGEEAARAQRQRVVQRLHDQQHDRLLRPVLRAVDEAQFPAAAQGGAEDAPQAGTVPADRRVVRVGGAVDEHRRHQRQQVRAVPVADRLDVGVLVDVDRGGDGDAVGEVGGRVRGAGGEDRLGVRAHLVPEALGDPRQVLALAVQQPLRAQRRRGDDDLPAVSTRRRDRRPRRGVSRTSTSYPEAPDRSP